MGLRYMGHLSMWASFARYGETAYLLCCAGPGYVGHLAMWDMGQLCRVPWSILTPVYMGREAAGDLAIWDRGE